MKKIFSLIFVIQFFFFSKIFSLQIPFLKIYNQENWGSAITDAERAIELDAGYAKAYHRLGVANMGLSKFKTAVKNI